MKRIFTIIPVLVAIAVFASGCVDIKPGSDPNSVNLSSDGKLPVGIISAILPGDETEDGGYYPVDPATLMPWVDLSSVLLGLEGTEGTVGVAMDPEGNYIYSVEADNPKTRKVKEDLNQDGLPDLVVHFLMSEVAALLAGLQKGDVETLEVTGMGARAHFYIPPEAPYPPGWYWQSYPVMGADTVTVIQPAPAP